MTSNSPSLRLRRWVHGALAVTGACGLIYEVTWQRFLANFLGSEAKASALILALFLGGLAGGYGLFGFLSRQRTIGWLIRLTGFLEIGIGVWALLFPEIYNALWSHVSWWAGGGLMTDAVITLILIFPPTLLMGGTLPLLTQAFSEDLEEAGAVHSWIYFCNTAGAFLGCLLAGFVLLPLLGLYSTNALAALGNWVAGLTLLTVGLFIEKTPIKSKRAKTSAPLSSTGLQAQRWPLFAAAFCSGLVCITLQIGLTRAVGLAVGSSEYAFGLVVALFIFLLAGGARSVATKRDGRIDLWRNQIAAAAGLALIYVSVPYWPYASHVVRALLTSVAPGFVIYHLILFTILTLFLGLAVHSLGRTMPLIFSEAADHLESLGGTVGSLYFVNTLGCMCGGVVGGYLIYFALDLDQVFKGCLLLLLLSSVFVALRRRSRGLTILTSVVLATGALLLPRWDLAGLGFGIFRMREATENTFRGPTSFYQARSGRLKTLYHRDGPTATMAVISEFPEDSSLGFPSILVNGKSDGSILGDLRTMRMMAHVPALLTTADLDQVAVIGFGTGVTVGSLGLYNQVKSIDVFELSPLVSEYAPFFDAFNHNTSQNAKVQWHIGDAYRQLLAEGTRYGLIASEPSNPWVTGVERLYSREFLTMAADHLAPGGIYAQWFHEYDISLETIGLVVNTFASVFADVRIFRTARGDVLLLGSREHVWPERLSGLEVKLRLPQIQDELKQLGLERPEDLLVQEIPVPKQFFAKSGVHTLEFPRLSYRAGFEFFLGTVADLSALVETPAFRPWSHQFSTDTLSAMWLRLHPDIQSAERLRQAACITQAGDRTACQRLDVQAALLRQEDLPGKFNPVQARALALVRDLRSARPALKSAAESESALKFLAAVESPNLNIAKAHIIEIAKPCFADSAPTEVTCRLQVIKSLATIGEVQAAYDLFAASKLWIDRLPGERKKELIDVILEASRANSAMSIQLATGTQAR